MSAIEFGRMTGLERDVVADALAQYIDNAAEVVMEGDRRAERCVEVAQGFLDEIDAIRAGA